MSIDKTKLIHMLTRTAAHWRDHSASLTEIDSRFGDGDHGVTIGKIADVLDKHAGEWDDDDIAFFLTKLAEAIMAVPGGSAAPLYGTFFEGLAEAVPPGTASIDAATLQHMLTSALENLQSITKAKIGDKTMMDAIVPAVQAAAAAGGSVAAILGDAAAAAKSGAEATSGFVSKFGRARNYGDATLGTPDVGALSAAMMFQGLCSGFSA